MSYYAYSGCAIGPQGDGSLGAGSLGAAAPDAADRLAELRCRSHGGMWLPSSRLCDYTEECREQGKKWEGDVLPNGTPVCVDDLDVPSPGGAGPSRAKPPAPTGSGALWLLPVAAGIGAIYYLVRR